MYLWWKVRIYYDTFVLRDPCEYIYIYALLTELQMQYKILNQTASLLKAISVNVEEMSCKKLGKKGFQ